MVFTEEDKAFINILYLNVYSLWTTETYETVPWQRTKNVYRLDNLITKLKKWMHPRTVRRLN